MCEQRGFVKTLEHNNLLKLGPVGALLQENLKSEWFYNMVINRDNSVFLCNNSFVETYDYAKEMCLNKLPFGIAEISVDNVRDKSTHEFDNYFINDHILLSTTMFITPSIATQFFYQWLKLRRIWWRKFSASPGRYSLTDICSNNDVQTVDIKAEYPWGSYLIERLIYCKGAHEQLTPEHLQIKEGHHKVQAHFIKSHISLCGAVLNVICDAYDDPDFQGMPRPLLRFHRKLAPYKISFAISATQAALIEELNQLALYLCRQLRNEHVSSLLLPSASKTSLEMQWCQYDQLGIPYTVLLNEKTLKNGVAFLRSRDTTLKEQIHITHLPTYVQQLFKNY